MNIQKISIYLYSDLEPISYEIERLCEKRRCYCVKIQETDRNCSNFAVEIGVEV